jgi:AcrR family transcriptional regulator
MTEEVKLSSIPDDIRDQLVRTATHLFINKGFDRTTTRELSRALGWSKGRLYQYVSSKDDLMDLLLGFFFERDQEFIDTATAATVNLNATEALVTAIRLYIMKNDRYQDLYKFITHVTVNLNGTGRQLVFESARKIGTYFEALVLRGVESGEFRTDNAELVAVNIFLLGDWATRRYILKRRYTVEEFISEMTKNILLQLGVSSSSVDDKSDTIPIDEKE